MAPETSAPASSSADPTVNDERSRHWFHFSMRWKLLTFFAGAFTIIFAFIAIWVFQYATDTAVKRLQTTLTETATGGAQTINGDELQKLIDTVPGVPDPSNEMGMGYPDTPIFGEIAQSLMNIYIISGNKAQTYTYFKEAKTGDIVSAVSAGYLVDPPVGIPYRVPYSKVVNEQTYKYMDEGLTSTTLQEPYTDAYGSWISAYTPIVNSAGEQIGALGVDYPMDYVNEVRADVQRRIIPVLAGTYIVLLLFVLLIASMLTRPLKRLTAMTQRIAEGEYDLDVTAIVSSRFPDEMYTLAESFEVMASKVAARERSLTQEVTRLKVEIDEARRAEAVRQITDSESFADIAQRAAEMRKRMRERDAEG